MSPATRRSASARWSRCATSSLAARDADDRARRIGDDRGHVEVGRSQAVDRASATMSSTPHGPSRPGIATASSVHRPGRTVEASASPGPASERSSADGGVAARRRGPRGGERRGRRCRIARQIAAGAGRRVPSARPHVASGDRPREFPDRDERVAVRVADRLGPMRRGLVRGRRPVDRAGERADRQVEPACRSASSGSAMAPAAPRPGARPPATGRRRRDRCRPPPVPPRRRPGCRRRRARPRRGSAGGRRAGSAGRRAG